MAEQLQLNFDAPAPGDLVAEIVRCTGLSSRGVRICATRYGAPLTSTEHFLAWRAKKKAARREMNNRINKRNYTSNRAARIAYQQRRIANLTPEQLEDHKARRAATCKKHVNKKYRADRLFRLKAMLRASISTRLRRARVSKSAETIELIGCSWPELARHLERKFLPGMSWENLGRGKGKWNIDHHVPVASVGATLERVEVQKMIFHYTNTQPMWHVENCRKGKRFTGKHQFPLLLD